MRWHDVRHKIRTEVNLFRQFPDLCRDLWMSCSRPWRMTFPVYIPYSVRITTGSTRGFRYSDSSRYSERSRSRSVVSRARFDRIATAGMLPEMPGVTKLKPVVDDRALRPDSGVLHGTSCGSNRICTWSGCAGRTTPHRGARGDRSAREAADLRQLMLFVLIVSRTENRNNLSRKFKGELLRKETSAYALVSLIFLPPQTDGDGNVTNVRCTLKFASRRLT